MGAQRRSIDGDNLPGALEFIKDAYKKLVAGQEVKEVPFAHIVDKSKIAESGDWSLSGERYKLNHLSTSIEWELVEMGDKRYFEIESGGTPSSKNPVYWDGDINWATLVDLPKDNFITEISDTKRKITSLGLNKSSAKLLPKNSILVSSRATIGRVAIARVELATNQGFKNIIIKDFNRSNEKFVALAITQLVDEMIRNASGGTFKEISKTTFSKLKIPLPPLEVQKAIVAEIDTYQKIIDGARQVVDNYKPSFKIDPDWASKPLGTLAQNLDGKRVPITKSKRKSGEYPYYGASGIVDWVDDYLFDDDLLLISEDGANLLARTTPIAFSITGKCWVNNHAHVLKFDKKTTQLFIEVYLNSISLEHWITGSAQPKLSQANLNSIPIPFPELSIQQDIFFKIQAEQELVNGNKKLIEIYEQKIKDKISEVWGE